MNKDSKDFQKYFFTALFPLIVVVLFFGVTSGVLFDLDGNAWATIITSSISSSCTLFLGFIAYWQNKQQRQDYQENKEKILKLEAKILELERKSK